MNPIVNQLLRPRPVLVAAKNIAITKTTPALFSPLTTEVTKKLNYTQQIQTQNQWCWAATSVSIALYFNAARPITQCNVVNTEFSLNSCCTDGSSTVCNKPYYLDSVMTTLGNLNVMYSHQISFADIQNQIYLQHSNPVACRIQWPSGGGHFVVVYGYQVVEFDGNEEIYVWVQDPWNGSNTQYSYSNFCSAYNGNGTWTHSYITQA